MMETLLAVIFMCSVKGECKPVKDKLGPSFSRIACQKRLDDLWERIQKNDEFLSKLHKEIGDYKINSQFSHRGFCISGPSNGSLSEQVEKYYNNI